MAYGGEGVFRFAEGADVRCETGAGDEVGHFDGKVGGLVFAGMR